MKCKNCGTDLEYNAKFCTKCGNKISYTKKLSQHFSNLIELYKERQNRLANPIVDEYIIFDFETTGLSSKTDKVIEIGALKVKNHIVIDKFSTFVNPQKNISRKISELTGITSEMLIDAPLEEEAFYDFLNFIRDGLLVAYNVNFDINFLGETLKRIGVTSMRIDYFDAMELAKLNFLNLKNYKLCTVVQSLNPNFAQEHRAISDCYAVKEILDRVTITRDML